MLVCRLLHTGSKIDSPLSSHGASGRQGLLSCGNKIRHGRGNKRLFFFSLYFPFSLSLCLLERARGREAESRWREGEICTCPYKQIAY